MARRSTRSRSKPAPPAPETEPRPLRTPPGWLVAAGAALLNLALCWLAFDPGPYVGGDNGAYVSLARGLLERGAYVDYWDPAMAPHTQFPPVFPLILAAGIWLGLPVWTGVKLIGVAFSAAAAGLSALWLRRILPPLPALVAGGLVAALPGPLPISNQVLSDVPFWCFAMLGLWAYARAEEAERPVRWEVLGAATLILGFFTRTAGLPLVVAASLWMVLHRRWRGLAILLGPLVPLAAAWAMRNRMAGGASAYQREFWWVNPYDPAEGTIGPLGLLQRIWENVERYGGWHLPAMLIGDQPRESIWPPVLATALVIAAVCGWAMRVKRPSVAELFVPLYVGLLLIWPATWAGERFLLPLMPLLIGYAALCLLALGARIRQPYLPAVVGAGILAGVAFIGDRYHARIASGCRAEYLAGRMVPCLPPVWSELLEVGHLVRGRLPEGSVVIHRKPSLFYAVSGYRSRLYPKTTEPDSFFVMVRETGADFVVVDQISDMAPYLHAVIAQRQNKFCIIREFSFQNAMFARILPDAPPPPRPLAPDEVRVCRPTPPY